MSILHLFSFGLLGLLCSTSIPTDASSCECVMPLGYEKVRVDIMCDQSYTTVKGMYIRNSLQNLMQQALRPLPIYVNRTRMHGGKFVTTFDVVIFYSPGDTLQYINALNITYLQHYTGLPILNFNVTIYPYMESCQTTP